MCPFHVCKLYGVGKRGLRNAQEHSGTLRNTPEHPVETGGSPEVIMLGECLLP